MLATLLSLVILASDLPKDLPPADTGVYLDCPDYKAGKAFILSQLNEVHAIAKNCGTPQDAQCFGAWQMTIGLFQLVKRMEEEFEPKVCIQA